MYIWCQNGLWLRVLSFYWEVVPNGPLSRNGWSRSWSSWSELGWDISNHDWTLLLLCDRSSYADLKSKCSDSSPLLSLLQDFTSKVEGWSSGFAIPLLSWGLLLLSLFSVMIAPFPWPSRARSALSWISLISFGPSSSLWETQLFRGSHMESD